MKSVIDFGVHALVLQTAGYGICVRNAEFFIRSSVSSEAVHLNVDRKHMETTMVYVEALRSIKFVLIRVRCVSINKLFPLMCCYITSVFIPFFKTITGRRINYFTNYPNS